MSSLRTNSSTAASSATFLPRSVSELASKRRLALSSLPLGQELYNNSMATVSKLLCKCPVCEREIGASRFAPHLEKCQQRRQRALSVSAPDVPSVPTPPWTVECWNCKTLEKPESMMLCDGCSRAFHLWCVTPRLSEMPVGYWFCRRCSLRLDPSGPSLAHSSHTKEPQLNAIQKAAAGRIGVSFEIVDYVCDLCEVSITKARYRCVSCGEFDVCESCFAQAKGGKGHRSTHKMAKIKVD